MEIFENKATRAMMYVYLGILLITPILGLYFLALSVFIIGALFFGVIEMALSKGQKADIVLCFLIVFGTIFVGLTVIEVGHAGAAVLQPDLKVSGLSVVMISWNENENNAFVTSGFTSISYNENLFENELTQDSISSQLSWTVAGGSISIAVLAFLFWIVPTPTNFPALIWTVMLFYHSLPALNNDVSLALNNGWMSSFSAWTSFVLLILPVTLGAIYSIRRGDKIV